MSVVPLSRVGGIARPIMILGRAVVQGVSAEIIDSRRIIIVVLSRISGVGFYGARS